MFWPNIRWIWKLSRVSPTLNDLKKRRLQPGGVVFYIITLVIRRATSYNLTIVITLTYDKRGFHAVTSKQTPGSI